MLMEHIIIAMIYLAGVMMVCAFLVEICGKPRTTMDVITTLIASAAYPAVVMGYVVYAAYRKVVRRR